METRTAFLFRSVLALVFGMTAGVPFCAAQAPPEFEALSIKPYVAAGGAASEENSETRVLPGGRFTGRNVDVMKLIRNAFLVEDQRISGLPGWAKSASWNIDAKTAGGVEIDQTNISRLMQSILESRFQFQFHRETKFVPVYALQAIKHGEGLKAHTGEGQASMSTNSRDGVVMVRDVKVTLADFAGTLTRQVGRPVIDGTGISGEFDIELEWSPDQSATDRPSVFTALQSIGLRLVPTRGPAEFIVVDRVEKPSEN